MLNIFRQNCIETGIPKIKSDKQTNKTAEIE